jgi:hypothetical protein
MLDNTVVECVSLAAILRKLNQLFTMRQACETEMLQMLRDCGEEVLETESYKIRRTLVDDFTFQIRRGLAMVGA